MEAKGFYFIYKRAVVGPSFFDLRIDAMLLFRLICFLTLSDFTVDVHTADGWKDQIISCAIRSPFPLRV
jgi:hypothetical protein